MESSHTIKSELRTPAPDLTVDLERLRNTGVSVFLTVGIVLWMLYMVNSFRLPTQEILLSDKNAGGAIRQVIFAGCGFLAVWRLLVTRSLGAVCMIHWPVFLVGGLIVFSAVWSERMGLTLKRSSIYIFGFLALACILHSSTNPVRFMIRTVVFFCGAVAFLSVVFYFILPSACTVNPGRPGLAGVAIHPNTLAPFLSIGLMLSFGFQHTNKDETLLLRSIQIFLVLALMLTVSITAIVTTLIGISVYIFLSSNAYERGSLQIMAFFVFLIVSLLGVSTLKSSFFDAVGRDESLSGRDELWITVMYEVKKEPLIGHGFGAFWTEGKGRELVQTWNPRQSHHAYVDILVDLGVVGLIVFLFVFPLTLILRWGRVAGKYGTWQRKAASSMLAVAFSYMSFYAMGQSFFLRMDAFPFFILLWITLLLSNRDRNNINREFETLGAV
ncbi:O-antigen ligase family protein [Puniceicoccaceae bacterium K14]|nr:O-antigen ligase family protein [Puniceicoccaceae bacterium K14]